MNRKFFIPLILIIVGFTMSCEKNNFNELSSEDAFAAEEMEKAYNTAKVYNDSLIWCEENNPQCSDEFIAYCDSIVDSNGDQYDFHHGNYSHGNDEDDHDHHGNSNEQHDGMMGHTPNHSIHNLESHEAMEDLMQNHDEYHIK
jgi:hypothetical protein